MLLCMQKNKSAYQADLFSNNRMTDFALLWRGKHDINLSDEDM